MLTNLVRNNGESEDLNWEWEWMWTRGLVGKHGQIQHHHLERWVSYDIKIREACLLNGLSSSASSNL